MGSVDRIEIALADITRQEGYPLDEAAPIAISSTIEALGAFESVSLARFCLFGERERVAFGRALAAAAASNEDRGG